MNGFKRGFTGLSDLRLRVFRTGIWIAWRRYHFSFHLLLPILFCFELMGQYCFVRLRACCDHGKEKAERFVELTAEFAHNWKAVTNDAGAVTSDEQ